ncbi:alpha/beta hydrolase [Granulosicoccus sp. 3-233]|uniref:alpha/beta hydrolase n=1 Tax=Granulosicoccus sp. 3-233 TaxID=3417969 RepID=UPI003D334E71
MLARRFMFVVLVAMMQLPVTNSVAGEITAHRFDSATLDRDYAYTIYLPDGYDDDDLHYPVLYLLHGSGGDENTWAVNGRVHQTLDNLIDAGDIPPMVVVMPGSLSWWVDGHNENARTAFFDDLLPHIEQTWAVIAERKGRLVAGLSAGGYGAVNFSLERPDLFAAASALSPAVYVPLPPMNSSAHRVATYQGDDGQFDPDLWEKLNYTNYLEAYRQQDRVVPMYINSGDHDVFNIAYHGAVLFNTLLEHQPGQVEFRVMDGDHEWHVWIKGLRDSLPFMARYISRPIGRNPGTGE